MVRIIMNVWVIKTSEMLATDSGRGRLLRSGMIAHMLESTGHTVTWWVSTFDHASKRQRFPFDENISFGKSGLIRLIFSPGYRGVVSIRRIFDHLYWGISFWRKIRSEIPPDIIFCAYPTVEAAFVCVHFGRRHGVPVVIDLRDMWPDIFVHAVPECARAIVRLIAAPYYLMSQYAFRNATALFGITREFVEWGLVRAGRPWGDLDRDYPLAYLKADLIEVEKTVNGVQSESEIEAFWSAHVPDIKDCFNVVMIGSLNGKRYLMDTVFAAAKHLVNDKNKINFIICGDGENLNSYRIQAEGSSNIYFPGWINAAQVRALMKKAHLGLVPYRNTPDFVISIPNKAVEYLSAGLPVVTCLNGTLSRVLKENGCGEKYSNENPQSLVELLRSIRDDEYRFLQMRNYAIKLFEEKFVAENVYGQLIDHLDMIASRAKVGQRNIQQRIQSSG